MITVSHLTKYYGEHLAVDDLSFQIDDGHVYGFLGPNGAGKSTTMNIMTGCLSATDGTVSIDGFDIFEQPKEAKRLIGYLPERPPLYMNDTPLEYLRFVGEAKGLKGSELQEQIQEVIEQTGLENMKNRRIETLSKGYMQRVGIAQALLGHPSVIILDEPTVGLDPIQIIEIRDLIRDLGKTHTVIFSSHVLSEVQTICDQVLIISHGKLVAFDEPANMEKQLLANGEINITVSANKEETEAIFSKINHVTQVSAKTADSYTNANIKTDCEDIYTVSSEIFRTCAVNNIVLYEMSVKKGNLEDVFLALTSNEDEQTESDNEFDDIEENENLESVYEIPEEISEEVEEVIEESEVDE